MARRDAPPDTVSQMDDPVVWERDPPELRSPVLIASFSGWNDAASAASTALGAVAASLDPELVARIDPEDFFDFQAARPTISVVDGTVEGIEWPENLIVAAEVPGAERDLLLLSGTEPGARWRSFCTTLIEVAEHCGVETVVTFGSLIADVAHTRPVPVTGVASDPEMLAQLGFEEVAYEGPTGITGVLHHACSERGMSSVGLWAAVPHYAAAVPNPKAALALLRRLEGMVGIALDPGELESATDSFERQVSAAVEANPEIKEMVERLESQQDDVAEFPQEVPSGDAIARDFQKFLRQQRDG